MCISKIGILVKMHGFLATPLFTETIPQGFLIIIEGGEGPIHYQAKGKNVLALTSGFLISQK